MTPRDTATLAGMTSPPITLRLADSRDELTSGGLPRAVDFTILQLNDTYDATPVEGGRRGGLARVATLRRRLAQENPNLLAVMVGDFLAPSPIGAITGDAGLHMIEALNAMGLTHATMGNHEFDISEAELRQRIAESRFKWIVSNVKDGSGLPFDKVDERAVITFDNGRGDSVRVALLGLCIALAKKKWLRYQDPVECAKQQVAALGDDVDVVVAMTHLAMTQDRELGEAVPRLDVLLGGHEHEAASAIVGEDATPIFKADSNARSAFVHRFRFDPESRTTLLFSEIVQIDEQLAEEPETAAIVGRWQEITFATLRAQGFEPLEVVGATKVPLNGSEADLRKRPTNLGQLVAETFLAEVPNADAAMLTAGMLRIDGVIPPGEILYYDVVRIFPLGGALSVMRFPGSLLRGLLDGGAASVGGGGFLILANIGRTDRDAWTIGGAPLVDDAFYTIVTGSLPAAALAYPPFKDSGASKLHDTREMRAILADRLRRDLPAPQPEPEAPPVLEPIGDIWVAPVLGVTDVPKNIRWFEALGWKCQATYNAAGSIADAAAEDAAGPALFANLRAGQGQLFLTHGSGDQLPATSTVWWVKTHAEVDAIHRRAVAAGVTVLAPPKEGPWGKREMRIVHPAGHLIYVSAIPD